MQPNDVENLIHILRACPPDRVPTDYEPILKKDEDPPNPKRLTAMGTPCARAWDSEWIETVNCTEKQLGRRICGAHLIDNTPCKFESNHHSGRCRFHGGFDLTGAPPLNRNAYIHGLYSRRLKTCAEHCPEWDRCPLVDEDIKAMPRTARPVCPYELAQYNCALADALDITAGIADKDPFYIHIAHNVALLQLLINRAAFQLRNQELAATTRAASANYSLDQQQVSPLITAITRLGGELRKYHAMLSKPIPNDMDYPCTDELQQMMRDSDPGPEPHQFAPIPVNMDPPEHMRNLAREAIANAVRHAKNGKEKQAIKQWQAAWKAQPHFTDNWTDALRSALRNTTKPPS